LPAADWVVQLFEPGAEPGRGLAYGTSDPVHLLNVPAAKMSAFADQPDHFRAALSLDAGAFASRRDYGAYVRSILDDHAGIEVQRTAVHRLEREGEGWLLHLGDGHKMAAAAVVLALGNEPPSVPDGWSGIPLIANPWSDEARDAIASLRDEERRSASDRHRPNMIDVILSLQAAGFRGRTLAFSRRGLLPARTCGVRAGTGSVGGVAQGNVLALWRWLRKRSGQVGFRAAVDSLRPHSAGLWQGWRSNSAAASCAMLGPGGTCTATASLRGRRAPDASERRWPARSRGGPLCKA
jgi:uncharacterized NAD(P)/FAD-binding protein YdhS